MQWDIFLILEGEPEQDIYGYELIGGNAEAKMKLLCKSLSNNIAEYRQLYECTAYDEVLEQLAMTHSLRQLNERHNNGRP